MEILDPFLTRLAEYFTIGVMELRNLCEGLRFLSRLFLELLLDPELDL